MDAIVATTVLGCMGDASETGTVAAFLASEAKSRRSPFPRPIVEQRPAAPTNKELQG